GQIKHVGRVCKDVRVNEVSEGLQGVVDGGSKVMQPSWRRRQQTAGVKAATNSIGGGSGKPVWLGRQQSLRRGQRLIKVMTAATTQDKGNNDGCAGPIS
ncbi:hypothetical protein U1Q18_001550, partial [Sarracenia purpurea var. burkii]